MLYGRNLWEVIYSQPDCETCLTSLNSNSTRRFTRSTILSIRTELCFLQALGAEVAVRLALHTVLLSKEDVKRVGYLSSKKKGPKAKHKTTYAVGLSAGLK